MEDRRRSPRIEKTFQVKYYPVDKENLFSYTITKDISRGGLCMPALSKIVRVGNIVKMDIGKGGDRNRLLATGKVRWAKAITRKALLNAEAGIEFVGGRSGDVDRLL